MTTRASGTFEVKLVPQPPHDEADTLLGRLSLDKQFHGDFEGTGKGQMLSAMTATQGSGAYVAIERVTGTLHGRNGSFVLQHRGVMSRGENELSITIVPDSGTDELAGISGELKLTMADGKHVYDIDYSLPD